MRVRTRELKGNLKKFCPWLQEREAPLPQVQTSLMIASEVAKPSWMAKNGQNKLKLSKEHCNGSSLYSLKKRYNCTVNM